MKRLFLTSEFFVVAKHIFKNYLTDHTLKVLFITTASETHKGEKNWVINDRKAWVDGGFDVIDFTITGKSKDEIQEAFDEADIIYSTGGNTIYYLKQIQLSNCKDVYRQAVLKQGKIYVGGSAGSIITSPSIAVKNFPDNPKKDSSITNFDSLHLVHFIIFPHWTREDFKKYYLENQLKYAFTFEEKSPKIILLTDNQYVRVEEEMYQVIDQRD